MDEPDVAVAPILEIGTHPQVVEYQVKGCSVRIIQPLSGTVQDLPGKRFHPLVGFEDAVLHAGRTLRDGPHYGQPFLHEARNRLKHLGTHGLLPREHQHAVFHAAVEHKNAVAHAGVVAEHVGVYIVKTVPLRKRRIAYAGHLGGVLADEIGDVGHIPALLQHEVAPPEIFDERAHPVEPAVVAVELVAEPGVAAGLAVVGLLDVQVQEVGVDALAEEAVCPLFHLAGIAVERRASGSAGFRPDAVLAVDVPARGGGAVFDVAESSLTPVFAGYLVTPAAVQQELAREAPVPVALQPGLEAVGVGLFPQAVHIVIGDAVGHKAAEVPQETLALFHGVHHKSLKYRQITNRIIAIGIFERRHHIVGPVLAAGLVAVFHHHLPRLAVFGRNTAKQLAHEGVVMLRDIFAAHLVHLQAGTFGSRRGIGDARRLHVAYEHGPPAVRHLPAQLAVFYKACKVLHGKVFHAVPVVHIRWRFPHVGVPHRERILEHLGE